MCNKDSKNRKEKLAIEELKHSLEEWAIRDTSLNREHAKFRSEATRQVRVCLASSKNVLITGKDAPARKFPKDLSAAYEHVLRFVSFTDKLGMDGFLEPYRRQFDKKDRNKVFAYRVKPEYKNYNLEQLDPLKRFTFSEMTKEECFFQEWFLIGDNNDASFEGIFMEAGLACHALQNEMCHSCSWNGGGNSSWQDLYCIQCKSTYEIKTKATTERIENAFKWNNFSGGSYASWCAIDNERTQPQQKRFLVLLPRKATFNRKMAKVYPVHIAEIQSVLPKLYPGSFNTSRRMRFKSSVSVKLTTKEKWFDLPSTGECVETWDIAEKVYIERFSQATFDAFMTEYFNSDDDENSDTNADVDAEVVGKLEQLKLAEAPDTWEELLSDED